jgi:hypothetical protein
LQLPPPYNTIIIGGAKSLLVHNPRSYILNDSEDKQFEGVPEFYRTWSASDVVGWPAEDPAELGKPVDEGGCWSGGKLFYISEQSRKNTLIGRVVASSSIDDFPFVGTVPNRDGHFVAAGFGGHGESLSLL